MRKPRSHDVRFDTEPVSRGCRPSNLLNRAESPEQMQQWFRDGPCSGSYEEEVRTAYLYDWQKPPGDCCDRMEGDELEEEEELQQMEQPFIKKIADDFEVENLDNLNPELK